MKFSLTFKTPDVIDQLPEMTEDEQMEVENLLEKFLTWKEYIHVEFDTVNGTAKVVE